MIEQAMFFALGFCIAGLLALLCLPAIARRALRMAQAAVERQMPISIDEIVAQRDLLRAEFATERRRIEQRLEQAQDAHAHEMSEAGRRAAELSRASTELTAVTKARDAAQADFMAARRDANEASAEIGALQKALYDADGLEAGLRDALFTTSAARNDLTAKLAAAESLLATTQKDLTDAAQNRDGLERNVAQLRLDLSIARAREQTLSAQIDNHTESLRVQTEALRVSAATEGDLRRRIADYERGAADENADLDMLRRTIVEIGREVVKLAEQSRAPTDELRAAERSTAAVSH